MKQTRLTGRALQKEVPEGVINQHWPRQASQRRSIPRKKKEKKSKEKRPEVSRNSTFGGRGGLEGEGKLKEGRNELEQKVPAANYFAGRTRPRKKKKKRVSKKRRSISPGEPREPPE